MNCYMIQWINTECRPLDPLLYPTNISVTEYKSHNERLCSTSKTQTASVGQVQQAYLWQDCLE